MIEATQNQPLTIHHIIDQYNAYPGETVTFSTRVMVQTTVKGYTLQVTLPNELSLQDYQAPTPYPELVPQVAVVEQGCHVIWKITETLVAGTVHEYRAYASVNTREQQIQVSSRAVAYTTLGAEEQFTSEQVRLELHHRGQYLRYLPALYEDDEFMGRFVMLFESFWKPIEAQVRQIHHYFDPQLTPTEMLPWLASWVDLVLDERWPEAQRRALLSAAVQLYRKRGTRRGLQEYLELYTGQKPHITEHRAHNLRLGLESRLGPGVALGKANKPHTFTITLAMPPIQTGTPAEKGRLAIARQQRIEAIIEAEKPAHTAYTLHIVEN